MYKSFSGGDERRDATEDCLARPHDWSVLLPFFNEEAFLADTLESLAQQRERPFVILIDNGSTDGSATIAIDRCRRLGLPHVLVIEARPGKVAALAAGMPFVNTPYVATCDADTWYPRDYLAKARALLDRPGHVAGVAWFTVRGADRWRRLRKGLHVAAAGMLLRGQCHSGGAGQVFRAAALRRAGGFDPRRWNLVLEDHEIVSRLTRLGRIGYRADFWCAPTPRQRDRASVRWTLAERLCYHATAAFAGDWFFRRYLAPRLGARRLASDRLRETPFQAPFAPQFTMGG